jgi:hypothetical protein
MYGAVLKSQKRSGEKGSALASRARWRGISLACESVMPPLRERWFGWGCGAPTRGWSIDPARESQSFCRWWWDHRWHSPARLVLWDFSCALLPIMQRWLIGLASPLGVGAAVYTCTASARPPRRLLIHQRTEYSRAGYQNWSVKRNIIFFWT